MGIDGDIWGRFDGKEIILVQHMLRYMGMFHERH